MKKVFALICVCAILFSIIPGLPAAEAAGTELITNGSFEDVNGSRPVGWSASSKGTVTIDTAAYSGSRAAKLTTDNAAGASLLSSWISLIGGEEYVLTYYVKRAQGTNDLGVKLEMEDSSGEPLEDYYIAQQFKENGSDWVRHTMRFTAPPTVARGRMLLRCFGAGAVCWDEVSLVPTLLRLSTDSVFYYPEAAEGTAEAKVSLSYYSQYAGGSVDFKLKDGANVLKSETARLASGTAGFTYPLSLLTELKKEYAVEAVLKDAGGTVLETKTQRIYKYPRPSAIADNGAYISNGKVMNPVIAYHVPGYMQLEECKKAGINVIQGYNTRSAATMKDQLDRAHAAGLKLLVTLYPDMKPAGDSLNLETTKAIVSAVKDHPAVFAYAVMDEPSYQIPDFEEVLEASYRAIRDIDDVHPVYIVDCIPERYADVAKYVDVFAIDPYPKGVHSQYEHIASQMKLAQAAVSGKKPVYTILQTFTYGNYFPSVNDFRHMAYQAMMEGADGIGYFCIEDAEGFGGTNPVDLHLTGLWEGMCDFAADEMDEGFELFVNQTESETLAENVTGDVRWSLFEHNGSLTAIALNTAATPQIVQIPLPDTRVRPVIPINTQGMPTLDNGKLQISLSGGQAACYLMPGHQQAFGELIQNGQFEKGKSDWIIWDSAGKGVAEADASVFQSGGHSLKMTYSDAAATSTFMAGQSLSLIPGQKYRISYSYRAGSDTTGDRVYAGVKLQFKGVSGADEVKFHRGLPQNVWNTEEIEFTVPAGATETGVELRLFGTGILYWDDVSVVKVVDNIVNNGSFEDGTAHWNKKGNESGTLVADTAVKNLGAASLKMTSDGGTLSAVQTLQLTPGYRYEVSVCYNGTGFADESHAELVLKYAGVSGKDVVREIRPVNQGLWYQDVFSFVVPADAAELELRLYGAGTMYWDDVTICRQDNLIQNGGFEDSSQEASAWAVWNAGAGNYSIDSNMKCEGQQSIKLTRTSSTSAYMASQVHMLIPGQKYTLTARLYVPSGQEQEPQPFIYVAEGGSTQVARENYYGITKDTWHSCQLSFVYQGTGEKDTEFQFRLNGIGTVYWDDIVLKPESLEPESNFLTNGSFEDGKNGWVDWNNNTYMPTPVKEHATDGDYSLKMQSDSWDKPPSIFQGAKVGEGNYMLRFKLCGKAPAAGGTIRADVLVEFKNEAGSLDPNHRFNVSFDELSEEMKEYAIPITANPGNPEICVTLRLLAKDCVGTVYWDNVRLEAYNAPAGVTFYNDESSEIFAPEAGVVRASYYAPPADAEQSVTLVAALFQISGNNMKLTSVSDPASDSLRTNRPCLAETELTIPDDGKNYMVQCFVWDSLDGMKPILKKSVLY